MAAQQPGHGVVVPVAMPDGSNTPVRVFSARDGGTGPLVMIWPGFGMGGSYYRPIAEELSSRGFPVATGELRGQGASTARATRRDRWGYHDLAAVDYPSCIRAAKQQLGLPVDHPTVLLTHSMGGQIGALFLARDDARELGVCAMFGVGSGSPYLPSFSGPMRRKLRLGTVVLGGGSRMLGYWPGEVAGFDPVGYGRQSGKHMAEWRKLALTNSFTGLSEADLDYPVAMQEVTAPVLLTRFGNDVDCPRASSEALAEHLPNADLVIEELPGELGHNRWARQPQLVADRFETFLGDIS